MVKGYRQGVQEIKCMHNHNGKFKTDLLHYFLFYSSPLTGCNCVSRQFKIMVKQGHKLSIRTKVKFVIRSEGLKVKKSQNFSIT